MSENEYLEEIGKNEDKYNLIKSKIDKIESEMLYGNLVFRLALLFSFVIAIISNQQMICSIFYNEWSFFNSILDLLIIVSGLTLSSFTLALCVHYNSAEREETDMDRFLFLSAVGIGLSIMPILNILTMFHVFSLKAFKQKRLTKKELEALDEELDKLKAQIPEIEKERRKILKKAIKDEDFLNYVEELEEYNKLKNDTLSILKEYHGEMTLFSYQKIKNKEMVTE